MVRYCDSSFLLIAIWIGSTHALGQESVPSTSDDHQAGAASREFRELIIQHAADFDSPANDQAISIVQRRGYTDSRFDKAIRKAMTGKDSLALIRILPHAIALMPHSTLSEPEQVTMLLDTLNVEYGAMAAKLGHGGIPIKNLHCGGRLKQLRKELAVQLKVRLKAEPKSAILCAAAELAGSWGHDLIPLLIKAAESGDSDIQRYAIASADQILLMVERARQEEEKAKKSAADADSRLRSYAARIVGRYDVNNDGELTQSEWQSMLLSPAPADTDGDGSITIEEYAGFLKSRSTGAR